MNSDLRDCHKLTFDCICARYILSGTVFKEGQRNNEFHGMAIVLTQAYCFGKLNIIIFFKLEIIINPTAPQEPLSTKQSGQFNKNQIIF